MKFFEVDLYDHYGVKKPEGGVGRLSAYVMDKSVEIDPNRKSPAMLVIPGGGYAFTSFREAEPVALKYLGEGFNAFVLWYSIAPVRYPYALTEARMAVAYIRENADTLGVDPNKISAVGFSAGGHLCGNLGLDPHDKESEKLFATKTETRPNAIVLGYPVIGTPKTHVGSFENLCGSQNPEEHKKHYLSDMVDENAPPAFIWATCDDSCVPVKNATILADRYADLDRPFSIHVFGKGQHGLSLANKIVYGGGNNGYASASKSVITWVDLSVEWLEELGLGN